MVFVQVLPEKTSKAFNIGSNMIYISQVIFENSRSFIVTFIEMYTLRYVKDFRIVEDFNVFEDAQNTCI